MHTLYIPKKGKANRNSDNTRKFSLENIQKHKLKNETKIKMLEIKCKHIFMSISKNMQIVLKYSKIIWNKRYHEGSREKNEQRPAYLQIKTKEQSWY